MKKFTNFLGRIGKRGKMLLSFAAVSIIMGSMSIVCFAADETAMDTTAISTALTTGLTEQAKSAMVVIGSVIVVGLGIFGAKKLIGWAKQFFNKVTG